MKRGTHREALPSLSGSSSSSTSNTGKAGNMPSRKNTLSAILIVLSLLVFFIVSFLSRMESDMIRVRDNITKSSQAQLECNGNVDKDDIEHDKEHESEDDTSCDNNPFQIWPILNIEKEVFLENYRTNTQGEREREEVLEVSPPPPLQVPCPRIFHPFDFFENKSSPGHEYLNHLKHLSIAGRMDITRVGLHQLTITKATTDKNDNSNSDDNREQEEFHLVFNSIAKTASTTIITAFQHLNKKIQHSDLLSGSYVFIRSEEENKQIMQEVEREWNATKASSLSSPPSSPSTKKFRHFGLIREPVSRFVSATAQEMTIRVAGQKAVAFREMCLKDNARDTLQCSLTKLRNWFASKNMQRMHFNPSAVVFYERTYGHDAPIELMEMSDLEGVLGNLLDDGLHENSQESKAVKLKRQKETDDVVLNMSVSDLTEEMIEEICALYAVDVLLLRHLKMEDKYCKGHISDKYVSTLYYGRKWGNGQFAALMKEWQ